jgi:hypothetical protein
MATSTATVAGLPTAFAASPERCESSPVLVAVRAQGVPRWTGPVPGRTSWRCPRTTREERADSDAELRCVNARTGQTRRSHANIRSRLIRVHPAPRCASRSRSFPLLHPASVLGCTSSGRQIWMAISSESSMTPVYFANVITRDVSPLVMSAVRSVFWARITRIR